MSNEVASQEVTRLLQAAGAPDRAAADHLLALVYDQLRKIARQRMSEERAGHTLEATALVHEAYLRLVGERDMPWQNRAHFFVAAAEAMRRILLDHAKARGRVKRGSARRLPVRLADLATSENPAEILALDEAFCRLMSESPAAAAVVRLRFYGGLSVDETAAALAVSPRQVDRLWCFARAWLFRELRAPAG